MRNALRDELLKIKKNDDNIHLIVGDIGFGVFEDYEKKFPDSYLNIGICESNMIGFAAGMASCNFTPIVYTIVPFLTMRAFEQIRVDLALHNKKVILVGVGGGLAYGSLGPTHHSFEDLAIISLLPNFTVFSPSQPEDGKKSLRLALENNGPSYIRLGKNGEPDLSKYVSENIAKMTVYNNSLKESEVLILTYGPITYECILASNLTKVKSSVLSLLMLKPLPENLIDICKDFKKIIIVEEHSTFNSIGTHIISKLMQNNYHGKIKCLGINDIFTDVVGSRDYLLKFHNLDSLSISKQIEKI